MTARQPRHESPAIRPIADAGTAGIAAWCAERGLPAYRGQQIQRWVFANRAADFAAMLDLPSQVREALAEDFTLFASNILRRQVARDRTEKLLLELADGESVETVLMRETRRSTVCISTQVGCAMGCVFCASGLLGVKRDLTTGEILEQIMRIDRLLDPDERITNIVVMGIGEPLANLRNLVPALELLCDEAGYGLSPRRITVSTVGLPKGIREFAALDRPFNLAVSLHAPNDELRTQIVPVNKNIGIEAILAAANDYFAKTGRRVSYEYVLLDGVNDTPELARELAALLRGRQAHVNVIPMNEVAPVGLTGSTVARTQQFVSTLKDLGINATVRKRKGADIDAACGQLRLHEIAPPRMG